MAVRIRYTPTELSDGIVEVLHNVDYFVVLDDNTLELREHRDNNKYGVTGYVHPSKWVSVVIVEDSVI